jgi:hypothetical protein
VAGVAERWQTPDSTAAPLAGADEDTYETNRSPFAFRHFAVAAAVQGVSAVGPLSAQLNQNRTVSILNHHRTVGNMGWQCQ